MSHKLLKESSTISSMIRSRRRRRKKKKFLLSTLLRICTMSFDDLFYVICMTGFWGFGQHEMNEGLAHKTFATVGLLLCNATGLPKASKCKGAHSFMTIKPHRHHHLLEMPQSQRPGCVQSLSDRHALLHRVLSACSQSRQSAERNMKLFRKFSCESPSARRMIFTCGVRRM